MRLLDEGPAAEEEVRAALLALLWSSTAIADEAKLVGIADAGGHVAAIGPQGQVYTDGVRTLPSTIAANIDTIERGAIGVIVGAGGAVYRLAPNGWTAVRLAQKGKAIAGSGGGALAALGRDVFDLDRGTAEPQKIATLPTAVIEVAGSAKSFVVRTDRGLLRMPGAKPIANVPGNAQLLGDRWAIVDKRGAIDLRSGKLVGWPSPVASVAAAIQTVEGTFVGVGRTSGGFELVSIGAKVTHEPIGSVDKALVPVGITVDKKGRTAIAFRDGTIATGIRGAWTTVSVRDELPPDKPGSPPATAP